MTRLLSPTQIAERLSLSRREVYRLIKDWPKVNLGERRIRVEESVLEAFIDSRRDKKWQGSTPAANDESTGPTTHTQQPASDTSAAPRPRTRKSRPNVSDSGNSLPSQSHEDDDSD